MLDNITVVILTYNEENNINRVLDSVINTTNNILVVDSYSTDETVNILKNRGIAYLQHTFDNYSEQRNWAQNNNPFSTEWVLHLDADEPISLNLSQWILNNFSTESCDIDGFMFSRRTIFMNRWIQHGGQYPNFHLRLYKVTKGKCENKAYDQHFVVNGIIKKINDADIINTVSPNLDDFIVSHNRWATKEALEVFGSSSMGDVKPTLFGNSIERRRWLKQNIFEKSPLLFRSFIYFFYRYFIRFGFLDGRPGLIFFVLQTFWFRFLIDAKVYELKLNKKK
jgi:glycosyltransferase involved in cell wall biosynthesis